MEKLLKKEAKLLVLNRAPSTVGTNAIMGIPLAINNLGLYLDPFDGAKSRPLGRGIKRRSGATLSKPQPSGWGVEGLTLWML